MKEYKIIFDGIVECDDLSEVTDKVIAGNFKHGIEIKEVTELIDEWDLKVTARCLKCLYKGIECDCNIQDVEWVYYEHNIKKMKEKILKDCDRDLSITSRQKVNKILDERFGF